MPVLRLVDVSHRFAASWVLLHIDLHLEAGDRVLLLGDNGGGKTTLLRLCATAIAPSWGEVRLFGGGPATRSNPGRSRLALMTHQHHFYEALSPTDNLRLVAALCVPQRAAKVAGLLDRVGLAHAANQPVQGFSAGMKRRLALARVLLLEPELVLFDEPFSQLDSQGVALVETVLDALQAAQVTWIMATHDAERGARLASHVLRLHQGSGRLQPLPSVAAGGAAHA